MKNKTQQEAQAALQYIFNHIDFRRLGSIKHGKITDAGETLRTFINQSKPKEIAGDREEALSYFNAIHNDLFINPNGHMAENAKKSAQTIRAALSQPDDVGELLRVVRIALEDVVEHAHLQNYVGYIHKCEEALESLAKHTNKGD